MPGQGRAPKHASARRRRNKIPGSAKLSTVKPKVADIPKLPAKNRNGETWHRDTKARWKAVHQSPMASEYTPSDFYGLLDLAHLWDRLHKAKHDSELIKASVEIRLMEQRFGLSPLDRRRLAWEIDKAETAEARTRTRRNKASVKAAASPDSKKDDPRDVLTA